jgi:hypothetical protein
LRVAGVAAVAAGRGGGVRGCCGVSAGMHQAQMGRGRTGWGRTGWGWRLGRGGGGSWGGGNAPLALREGGGAREERHVELHLEPHGRPHGGQPQLMAVGQARRQQVGALGPGPGARGRNFFFPSAGGEAEVLFPVGEGRAGAGHGAQRVHRPRVGRALRRRRRFGGRAWVGGRRSRRLGRDRGWGWGRGRGLRMGSGRGVWGVRSGLGWVRARAEGKLALGKGRG